MIIVYPNYKSYKHKTKQRKKNKTEQVRIKGWSPEGDVTKEVYPLE